MKIERSKFENKLFWSFIAICMIFIIIISKSNINPSDKLFYISIGLFLFPLTLTTIYIVSKIEIISDYSKFRKEQERKISNLQQLVKAEKEINKRVDYSEQITLALNKIGEFGDNRFRKQVIISSLTLIASAFFSFINVGQYINIQNWIIVITLIFIGIYYSTKTLTDIFFSI